MNLNLHDENNVIFLKQNELLSLKYDDISNFNLPFIDPHFPPDEDSLGFNLGYIHQNNQIIEKNNKILQKSKYITRLSSYQKQPKYFWERISKITSEYYLCRIIQKDDELLDDVIQGKLGDCYFLSALNALAEKPKRILDLIPKSFEENNINNIKNNNNNLKTNNKEGVLRVYCYINGLKKEIVMDDYFPVEIIDKEVKLCFSSIESKSKNIWPLMFEKAWAKLNYSYYNIINGNVSQALEFLTPAPIDIYFHDSEHDVTDLFSKIKFADENDYIICCDISDKPNETQFNRLSELGLLTNHAYSIISVHNLRTGERLLKIRNPWGSFEWNGAWSDSSLLWTPEARREVNYPVKSKNIKLDTEESDDDGFFFMEYSDYIRFFTCSYICKLKDDFSYTSEKYIGNKYFSIDFQVKQDCFLIVNLKNSKLMNNYLKNVLNQRDKNESNNIVETKIFENCFCSVIVFKKETNNNNQISYSYLASTASRLDRIHIELKEAFGSYIVEVCFPNSSNEKLDKPLTLNNNTNNNTSNNNNENLEMFSTFEENRESSNQRVSYRFGIYCSKTEKVVINEIKLDLETKKQFSTEEMLNENLFNYDLTSPQTTQITKAFCIGDYAEGVYSLAAKSNSSSKNYFYQDSEPNTWRALVFESDDDSFGALVYRNDSNALLLEVLEFKEIFNLVFIPFDLIKLPKEAVFIENKQLEEAFESAKQREEKDYCTESIEKLSEKKFCVKIPPKSIKIFMVMKTEEVASISVSASSQLLYPTHFILRGNKFNNLSKRLVYKDGKEINIIETFIRHNSGVLFLFNNRTSEFKFAGNLILEEVSNLQFNEYFDQEFLNTVNVRSKPISSVSLDSNSKKFTIKVNFVLYPSELVFFDFKSMLKSSSFEFTVKLDYKICFTEEHVESLLSRN